MLVSVVAEFTVNDAVPLRTPEVAVIVAEPADTPLATPPFATVAMDVLLLDQLAELEQSAVVVSE